MNLKRWLYAHPYLGHVGFEAVRHLKRLRERMQPSDLESVPLLRRLRAVGLRPRTIVDIGANRGEWARNAHDVFPEAAFHLIEPQQEMAPFLERVCADLPNASWYESGAAAEAGEMTLAVWDDLAGSSFVPSEGASSSRKQRSVPVLTLDGLIEMEAMPVPDLVKMDVQGFELEVLEGAQQCLGHTEVFILETALFEFMPGRPVFHEIIRYMADRAYVAYDFGGFHRRPYDGALSHADVCFVREEGPLRASTSWS